MYFTTNLTITLGAVYALLVQSPRLNSYFGVKGVSLEDSQAKLDALSAEVLGQFE